MGAIIADRRARFLELIASEPVGEDGLSPGERFLSELTQRMLGATGVYESWGEVCKAKDVGGGPMLEWLMADAGRYGRFHEALKLQRELLADEAAAGVDEIVGIADQATPDEVAVAKLRVAARKDRAEFRTSLAAVMTPERYGRARAVREVESAAPDAALIGAAGDLLKLVAKRVLEGEPRVVDGSHEVVRDVRTL